MSAYEDDGMPVCPECYGDPYSGHERGCSEGIPLPRGVGAISLRRMGNGGWMGYALYREQIILMSRDTAAEAASAVIERCEAL